MRKFILPAIVLLALIALFMFPMGEQLHSTGNNCDEAIKTLENKNALLEKERHQLDERIQALKHQADSLMLKVQQEEQTVMKLKKKRNEKIQAIDHYTIDELVSFFTNLKTDSPSVRQ